MLPAHDVSGLHPLSCFSLSQREAIPSPGKIQRILGESDGRGNLPGLHPIRLVTVIRPLRLSNCSASPIPAPASAGAVVCPIPCFLPLSGQKHSSRISPSARNPGISKLPRHFEHVCPLGCGIAVPLA